MEVSPWVEIPLSLIITSCAFTSATTSSPASFLYDHRCISLHLPNHSQSLLYTPLFTRPYIFVCNHRLTRPSKNSWVVPRHQRKAS